jgi:hypothetical protein
MTAARVNRRYVAVFLLAACVAALGTAGINYLVDPYGLFGVERIEGFSARKPASAERVRVVKPYLAEQTRPRTVIGGNSRPEMGLDPQSPCWNPEEKPVFNAGIPGASFRMQTLYAQHAVLSGEATTVLLGVDLLDFLTSSAAHQRNRATAGRRSEDERRLRLDQPNAQDHATTTQRLADQLTGLFSLVALGDSVATVLSQRNPFSATRQQDGFNPALDYIPIVRTEGQAVLFVQKNQEVRARLQREDLSLHDAGGQRAHAFDALEEFLLWARDTGLQVILFINPYHVDYMLLIEHTGKWSLLEDWKRELTLISDRHSVALWDFNFIGELTSEPPPRADDRHTQLRWFWEPAHYRKELGELMLAAMLGRSCRPIADSAPALFGSKITGGSLTAHLQEIRSSLMEHSQNAPLQGWAR